MITSFQGWSFSEFQTDDGDGVIKRWITTLDEAVRAEIEARMIRWAISDQFLPSYTTAADRDRAGQRFEPLQEIRVIEVAYGRMVYRILGSHFSLWEFVMLMGDIDRNRRSQVNKGVTDEARRRLDILRRNPKRRRPYEI